MKRRSVKSLLLTPRPTPTRMLTPPLKRTRWPWRSRKPKRELDAAVARRANARHNAGRRRLRAGTGDRHGADGRGADDVRRARCVRARAAGGRRAGTGAGARVGRTRRLAGLRRVLARRHALRGADPQRGRSRPHPGRGAGAERTRVAVWPRQPARTGALADRSARVLRRRAHQGVGGTHGGAARRCGRHHRWRDGGPGASDRGVVAVALQGQRRGAAAAGPLGRVRVGRVRLRQLHDDRPRRGWCARRGKHDGRDSLYK